MTYTLPADVDERPVAVDGAGTLGRRIAAVYAAGGSQVRIFDPSPDQCDAAIAFCTEQVDGFKETLGPARARVGGVEVADDLEAAVRGAWMAVEAAPERLELKREVLAELDRLADPDAIVASNSSSLPTSQLIGGVAHPERVLNTHYYMPPAMNAVELMSCGETDDGHHRRADRQAPGLRAGAVPRPARERRVHLQPHLGGDQARDVCWSSRKESPRRPTSTRCGTSSSAAASHRLS